jgi:antitoxin component YwqK of YwqJK toxin-antitoxin module
MNKPVWLRCLVIIFMLQSCFPYKSPAPEKQQESPGYHVKKIYYQNGALHKEIAYAYGSQQGMAKEYYKSGKIFQEVMYENNFREGVARRYFESGVVSQETPYHLNQMHGVQKRYH